MGEAATREPYLAFFGTCRLLRELRTEMTTSLPAEQAELRLRRHRKSLEMRATIPESRLVELLRFEIEALGTLPPASPPDG
jgi:hypothetical protein